MTQSDFFLVFGDFFFRFQITNSLPVKGFSKGPQSIRISPVAVLVIHVRFFSRGLSLSLIPACLSGYPSGSLCVSLSLSLIPACLSGYPSGSLCVSLSLSP
jgi:hypothetical protein